MDLKSPRVNRIFTSKFDIGFSSFITVFMTLNPVEDPSGRGTSELSQGTSMKKILTAIAAAVFIIYPCVCFASYVIHLKDGREFATEQYSEEGDQIKFKRYEGVIGVERDLVKGLKR